MAGAQQPAEGRRLPGEEVDEGVRPVLPLGGRQRQRRPAEDQVAAYRHQELAWGRRLSPGVASRPVAGDDLLGRLVGSCPPDPLNQAFVVDGVEPGVAEGEEGEARPGWSRPAAGSRRPGPRPPHRPGDAAARSRRPPGGRAADLPRPGQLVLELLGHRHEVGRRHAQELLSSQLPQPQPLGQVLDGLSPTLERMRVGGTALEGGAVEETPRRGHGEERGDAHGPGRLAEDGHVGRVTAEAGDVVAHRAKGGQLVEESQLPTDSPPWVLKDSDGWARKPSAPSR